jgi:HlyD family secretion protein
VVLSFPDKGLIPEGPVNEVLVRPGDQVEQGAILARLDIRPLQQQVEAAKAALAYAQGLHDRLMAGTSPEEIQEAQARVALAQAKAREIKGGVTQQDVAAAQANIARAQATLAQQQAGPKPPTVQAATAGIDAARARLQSQRDSLSAAKTDAQLRMEQAANTLRERQANYSRISWANKGKGAPAQVDINNETDALLAVQEAERALEQSKVAYEQARQAEITGISVAEADVRAAQAALDELLVGTDADQVAAARAMRAQAVADMAKLQGEQRAGALSGASADEAIAQAMLKKLQAPPRDADSAVTLAQVQEAQATLKRAELILDQAALRAPFSGTVVAVNLKVGEVPGIGQPGIVLADFSSWRIMTEDMTEQNVVRIHEGDAVTIGFPALPDFQLSGKVTRIEAMGQNSLDSRNVIYTVVITPDQMDTRLRWNMTASVVIGPKV